MIGETPHEMAELAFKPVAGETGTGLEVVDPIERHRVTLGTSRPVSPKPAATVPFRFPVDETISIETEAITLSSVMLTYVRDSSGEIRASAEHFAAEELPEGTYTIELDAPIKLYLHVDSSVAITTGFEQMQIAFGDETEVSIGARSRHDHPATTITTTTDPADIMQAVAAFSSALKTTTPERSYPTLRGHPPAVELGKQLHIPDGLTPPETGITIELPPTYASIYTVAPLAYYLGADLVPGDQLLVRTDSGFEYTLGARGNLEIDVERLLKHVFFMECLIRTEGLNPVDLHERRAVESAVDIDLDFATLYAMSPAERLEASLNVPFTAIEDHIPEWKLTTHVEPVATSVETLPFLVNDLAVIRTPNGQSATASTGETSAPMGLPAGANESDGFTRSASVDAHSQAVGDTSYVEPEVTESLEQSWVGEGTPIGASKVTTTAYHNRLTRTPNEGDIAITVVCNDTEMDDERGLIDNVYGDRSELPFSVTVRHNLTTDELRSVLAAPADFLHYIGHIDEDGFACADGKLDATTLDSVAVDAFLLNACQSYEQGMALIDAGSIGGIVTLTDVVNSGAVRIGQTLARLLNCGFPLGSALELAKDQSFVGGQYLVIGDSGLAITHVDGGTPYLYEIESQEESFRVETNTFPTTHHGMGTLIVPGIEHDERYYLSSNTIETSELSKTELEQLTARENAPVRIDGKLHWTNDLDVNEI
jgi:hypothetical protein